MRPASETWEEAQQQYWQFEPFITTSSNDCADSANAAAVIEADRAALVTEICEWLGQYAAHLVTDQQVAIKSAIANIQAKWGSHGQD